MSRYLLITADGARARLLAYETKVPGPRAVHLVERADLVNPEFQRLPHEKYRGRRRGARSRVLGHFYTVSDHRSKHDAEVERQFASRVMEEGSRLAKDLGVRDVVIAADPRMLGLLRGARDLSKEGFVAHELASDLTRMPPVELERRISKEGILPG